LEKLPTKENLIKREIELGITLCELCKEEVETAIHLFFGYKIIKKVWINVIDWWD